MTVIGSVLSSLFLSTPSVGRATDLAASGARHFANFYPRPPWGGRQFPPQMICCLETHFYPRPPWGGRRCQMPGFSRKREFLSTPSVGRATAGPAPLLWCDSNFYPRPPWGGRQKGIATKIETAEISIHALRGEGDDSSSIIHFDIFEFLSTPSVGRATPTPPPVPRLQSISIHALRGEGDG